MSELKIITTPQEMMQFYPLLVKIDFIDTYPESVLAKCILGTYFMIGSYKEGKPQAVVVNERIGDTCFAVGLYAKNCLREILDKYLKLLKELGYIKLKSLSDHSEAPYKRLLSMKKLWTVFEREL